MFFAQPHKWHLPSGSLPLWNSPLRITDTSGVTSMAAAFAGAYSFNQPLYFDTSSMQEATLLLFESAFAFNQRLAHWALDTGRCRM